MSTDKFCPGGCGRYKWDCACPPKGFISAPTPDQLKPTPHEQHLLECLWQWERSSAKSQTVWDEIRRVVESRKEE